MNKRNFKFVILLLNFLLCFYAVQAQENPRAAEAQQLLKQALTSLTEEKYDDTIEKITKVLEIYPNSGDVYSIRALAYKGKNDNDKAIDDLTKALSLQISAAGELRSRKLRGMMLYENKRYNEAIKDLDFAIAKDPSDFRAFVFRAWSYFFKGDYEPAITDFNAALKLSPQEKEIRRFRAQSYFYLGNYEKAIEDINEELRINQKPSAEAYKIRANAYRKLGKNDLAEADEKKYVELGGKLEQNIQPKKTQNAEDKLKGLLEKSQKHFENEEWDLAIRTFTEILSFLDQNDENLYAVYFARGRSFYQSDKYDLALSDYNEVIKRRPDLPDGYTFRGEVYIKQNQLDLALFDFNKAIRIDPENILAFRRRAEVYSLKREYDKAIKDCDEVIKLDPKFMSAWFYRAEAYFEKGNYRAALSDISEYIKLESSNSGAYSFRAKVYRKLGEEKLAKADEQKAEQLSSKKK